MGLTNTEATSLEYKTFAYYTLSHQTRLQAYWQQRGFAESLVQVWAIVVGGRCQTLRARDNSVNHECCHEALGVHTTGPSISVGHTARNGRVYEIIGEITAGCPLCPASACSSLDTDPREAKLSTERSGPTTWAEEMSLESSPNLENSGVI